MYDLESKEDKKKKNGLENFGANNPLSAKLSPEGNKNHQDNDPTQSMVIPGGYNIGDDIRINKDHSNIDYGPWKITKNGEGEDSVHYHMELDAKLIDDTGKIDPETLNTYKDNLKSSFENTYAKGEGTFFDSQKNKMITVKWTGKINISVADNNSAVTNRSMHVRIRDDGRVPETTKGEGNGYARHGYSVVYINKKILNNTPATEGIFKGTGLSDSGQPTLQRTFAHEVFHTLFLFHPENQVKDPYFGIPQARFDAFHGGKNLMYESQTGGQGMPHPNAGDQLIPDQIDLINRQMELKNNERKMKEDVRNRNKKR